MRRPVGSRDAQKEQGEREDRRRDGEPRLAEAQLTYALVDSALDQFGDAVCSRYLEYRLFLRAGLKTRQYTAYAIAVPDAATYAAGSAEALCALAPANGGTVTGDAYRPMP